MTVSVDPLKVAVMALFQQDGVGAVAGAMLDRLREIEVTPQGYGADATGAVSAVTAFQNMMTAVDARTTARKIRIPKGTYLFTIASDADTILIPSNVEIECDPGVVFKWGYWGSPLFAIVNESNVKLKLNGAKLLWTGTFGVTSGSSDKFSFGKAIPAYEWCAHIVCMGSEYVWIDGARCAGNTTANVQNALLSFRGKSDNTTTKGNRLPR